MTELKILRKSANQKSSHSLQLCTGIVGCKHPAMGFSFVCTTSRAQAQSGDIRGLLPADYFAATHFIESFNLANCQDSAGAASMVECHGGEGQLVVQV